MERELQVSRDPITYKPNDGTTGKDVLQNVGHDTDPKLKATLQSNTFQISGWLFGGWNEAANGTEELRQPNDTWELADQNAKILYAQWYRSTRMAASPFPARMAIPRMRIPTPPQRATGH